MDYEFLRDITGVVKVRMSMDHEAIGHWFNEEVKGNLALLDEVEQAARTVKGSERSWQRAGHEYTLWLDGEEVMIRANQLEFSGDEIEEGMSYYDEEVSLCAVLRISCRWSPPIVSLCSSVNDAFYVGWRRTTGPASKSAAGHFIDYTAGILRP